MAKRYANRTPSRLRWVIDTFPYFVAERVMGGVAQYQGYERFPLKALPTADAFLRARTAYPWLELLAGPGEKSKERLYEQLEYFRDTREIDKYIPWLAAELNAAYRPVKKTAKRVLKHRDKTGKFWLDESSVAYDDLMNFLNAEGRIGWLAFGAIATWAEATGQDLKEWDLPTAGTAAIDWMEHHQPEVDVDQGEVVYEFADGWTIQRLTTQDQFWNESQAMGHCVGKRDETGCYYYPAELAGIEFDIYSLREPKGKPHATIEVTNPTEAEIQQIRGKGNAQPKHEYMGYVTCWILNGLFGWRPEDTFRETTEKEDKEITATVERLGLEFVDSFAPTRAKVEGLEGKDDFAVRVNVPGSPRGMPRPPDNFPEQYVYSHEVLKRNLEDLDARFSDWWDETGFWDYVGHVAGEEDFDNPEEFEQWESEMMAQAFVDFRDSDQTSIPHYTDEAELMPREALALWQLSGFIRDAYVNSETDEEFYRWLESDPEAIWNAYREVCVQESAKRQRAANKLKRKLSRYRR